MLHRTKFIGGDLRKDRGTAKGEHSSVEETPSQKPSTESVRVSSIRNGVSEFALMRWAIVRQELDAVNPQLFFSKVGGGVIFV